MKTRNGFVSNSSSSSYIIIDNSGDYDPSYQDKYKGVEFFKEAIGMFEFGWGPETVNDVEGRINFALFQAEYANNIKWIVMLEKVIKKYTGASDIIWGISAEEVGVENSIDFIKGEGLIRYSSDKMKGYIDHGSIGDENTRMFDNLKTLKDFIFGMRSKVEVDNDNH